MGIRYDCVSLCVQNLLPPLAHVLTGLGRTTYSIQLQFCEEFKNDGLPQALGFLCPGHLGKAAEQGYCAK